MFALWSSLPGKREIRVKNKGVWHECLNICIQFLNNITHIFTLFKLHILKKTENGCLNIHIKWDL